MTPIQASILSNCRIESNRIESKNRFVSVNRIDSNFFHPNRNALLCVRAVFPVVRCESVRLSVTIVYVYYIQTAEDIVKLLSPAGSHIILFFEPMRRYPILKETPSSVASNTPWVGKICDFRLKSTFVSETDETGPLLLWNFSRKS